MTFKIVSQNMNSLNLSTYKDSENSLFKKKISSLLLNKAEIYFLQDIRLGGKNGENILKNHVKFHHLGNYNSYLNSKYTSRGVGILIDISLNFNLINTITDDLGNLLILIGELDNIPSVLVNVYGPNENNRDFWSNLLFSRFSCYQT